MSASEGLLTALERNWAMVDMTLADLDEATMAQRPNDQCNSIAWTLWHMNRVVDTFINTRLSGSAQLWIQDGWHQRFGMEADADNRGVGWTAQQVGAWQPPSKEAQLGYFEAAKAAVRQYLEGLSYSDLEVSRVIAPVQEPRTVASALGQMVWDNVAHGGQIAYLRGLFQGMGWYNI